MRLLPASSELAANAGTGPEGHKRSASVDSGASSDATIVVASIDGIDGAVDGSHKSVAIEKGPASPPERSPKRAACNEDPAVHDAQRGRVSTDTASGAPALATTTNAAGSPTAAAPKVVSIDTATAFAVADPVANALNGPNEARDPGHREAAPAHNAATAAPSDASSAAPDVAIALGTPAPASSAIVDNHDLAPASASTTTGAASALGATASKSDTIVANETSRGNAGCPETPVISRRSHAVPKRAFSIGRTSTPAPGGGSKSAVIVANATSRVGAHCPPTPLVSRVPVPRAVYSSQYGAFSIGRRSCTLLAAALVPATALAAPQAPPAPAAQPMPATALGYFGRAGSHAPPQSLPSRIGALRAISRVVQRGMGVIRNALLALLKGDIEPTDGARSTSPGPPDEGAWWDEDASIDAVLLRLRRRQRRRFL